MMEESIPTEVANGGPTSTLKNSNEIIINDMNDSKATSSNINTGSHDSPLQSNNANMDDHLELSIYSAEDLDTSVLTHEDLAEALIAPLVMPACASIGAENEIRVRRSTSSSAADNMMSPHQNAHMDMDMDMDIAESLGPISPNHFYNKRKERLQQCCHRAVEIQGNVWRNTITLMNFMAKVLFWSSLLAMTVGIVYYTRELAMHGKEPHLIAWFSAGAFVILGFPISIYGILMHLTNYYQPNIQCYVVRILWMVPIYSIESWLCLRFHEVAIYIETLRDCYESFVLYCFLQFLIEVLGGEESLILLLKDKSPTRGIHIWGFNWCIKPWIMGQPISTVDDTTGQKTIKWTSPFFKNCKFGCLQYVLLKLITSIFVMILEKCGYYKEGDFTYKRGYLYICILTNTSQCWALYCLVFFYYATKNELGPIRPVGKFLSVKALVFFTWWQSVGIAFLHQMDLIPAYAEGGWTSEEVAKGLQAYLICIEMFAAAIVHTFVFPHTDYTRPLATTKPPKGVPNYGRRVGRRLGRRHYMGIPRGDVSICSKTSDAPSNYNYDFENQSASGASGVGLTLFPMNADKSKKMDGDGTPHTSNVTPAEQKHQRTGFVNAFIDSAVPRDVMDNTVLFARGDFTVEKKTLLYHAAASDEYSLFAKRRKAMLGKKRVLIPKRDL